MGFLELFLIGVGLSMDAFAVAICQGLSMTKIKWGHALTVGLYFGGFQALMPLLGWVLGSQFSGYIQQYDHWVAFILLLLIGGNMIRRPSPARRTRRRTLLLVEDWTIKSFFSWPLPPASTHWR